jgi:hypothetical protein
MKTLARVLLLLLAAAPAAAQGDPSFTLVNRSGQAIRELYVSPVVETTWGRDWLNGQVLPDGRSLPVRLSPAGGCRQDIRVVFGDGRQEERRGENTCGLPELVIGRAAAPWDEARAANPSFNLVNRGRQPIREIYVSSARDTHWGENRLAQGELAPGAHLPVRLVEGDCATDIRVVWADGRRVDRRAFDTCAIVNVVMR